MHWRIQEPFSHKGSLSEIKEINFFNFLYNSFEKAVGVVVV